MNVVQISDLVNFFLFFLCATSRTPIRVGPAVAGVLGALAEHHAT
jgi:hypothetical protein